MAVKWYVLHSKPNQEEFLNDQLSSRNIEVFYPFLRVKPVNPRSKSRRAFFPGYLFIHVDMDNEGVSTFARIPGAANLVSFGGEMAVVPENIVQAIRKKVELTNLKFENHPILKPGDSVVIQDGLFEGYEGVIDTTLSGAERVRVFLKLLQSKNMTIELPATSVAIKKKSSETK